MLVTALKINSSQYVSVRKKKKKKQPKIWVSVSRLKKQMAWKDIDRFAETLPGNR